MIKIRIESDSPTCEGVFDSCEICDTNYSSDSPVEDYFDLFLRSLLAISFSEKLILNGLIRISREYKHDLNNQIDPGNRSLVEVEEECD